MISLVSSQVRFRRTGSWARAFQKFVTLSILRVALMSSYTARTAGLALSYSMKPRVDMMSAPRVDSKDRRNRNGIARNRAGSGTASETSKLHFNWAAVAFLLCAYRFRRFRCDSARFRRSLAIPFTLSAATYPLSFWLRDRGGLVPHLPACKYVRCAASPCRLRSSPARRRRAAQALLGLQCNAQDLAESGTGTLFG